MENLPRILSMKAYLAKAGMPIYYGYDDEDKVFCHPEKQWVVKPTYLDHFRERELRPEDLHHLILNGLIDEKDFGALSNQGLIDPILIQFFHKMKHLQDKVQEYEDMQPLDTEEAAEIPELPVTVPSEQLVSILDEFLNRLGSVQEALPNSALRKIIDGTKGLSDDERRILTKITDKFQLDPLNV
jgi:hypothetical protein